MDAALALSGLAFGLWAMPCTVVAAMTTANRSSSMRMALPVWQVDRDRHVLAQFERQYRSARHRAAG